MSASSRNNPRPEAAGKETEKFPEFSADIQQIPLAVDRTSVTPGSLNDSHMIRVVLADSIRRSGKTREQIAEEMSYLVGREVTARMLYGFTADSKDDYRWPAELDRAFAVATGDDRILKCRVEAAGYKAISGNDIDLLELGRQYLKKKRSEAEIAERERRLEGSEL